MFLKTLQSQIFANNAVHRGVMNASFSGNLECWSMRLWCVFLTRDQIINCRRFLSSIRAVWGRPLPMLASRCRTGVSEFFSNLFSELKAQPLSGNSLISFFRTLTFKNVQIFYQNSIIVSETHVYVKTSFASLATHASAPRLNKKPSCR